MELSLDGFVAQLKGSLTKRHYKGATISWDHVTDDIHVSLMTDFTGEATSNACREFEVCSSEMGVTVRHYHCDNGRFTDNKFLAHCKTNRVSVFYCRVNAHHQNGLAERTIGILQDEARLALWHAVFRWSSMLLLNLWLYAIRNAADIRNSLPIALSGQSPLERYSNFSVGANFNNFHSLCCPVYHLNSTLAAGKKIRQWEPRSQLGINLGRSPWHARNINLILNTSTGLVPPQFHVSYDDFFESVRINKDRESQPPLWQNLSGLKGRGLAPHSIDIALTRPRDIKSTSHQPTQVEDEDVIPATYTQETNNNISSNDGEDQPSTIQEHGEDPDYLQASSVNKQETVNNDTSNPMSFLRSTSRSGRQIRPTAKMKETLERGDYTAFESIFVNGSSEEELEEYYDALHQDDYEIQDEMKDPIAFLANSDRDTMYYHQTMKQPDKEQFQQAMEKEFMDQCHRKHW